MHVVSLRRASVGMLSLENVLEEKSHIYVGVCGCMCSQCGSASFRAFISSCTRVLISEKAYKCTEFEKMFHYITASVSTAETCLYYKNRNSFHLSLRSHCVSENISPHPSARPTPPPCPRRHLSGRRQPGRNTEKSTEERKYFLRPLRRIIANCLLMSVSLPKKKNQGGVILNQDSRFYLGWRNWSAMEIPQSVSPVHIPSPLLLSFHYLPQHQACHFFSYTLLCFFWRCP